MFALNLLTLALGAVSAVVAAPAHKRAMAPSCSGLGGGVFDTADNFTLAAYFTNGNNANDTGLPLVLGQAGAISGASFKVLSTYASYPFNSYPSISLEAGRLVPTGPNVVPAGGLTVADGAEVSFIASSTTDPTQGAQIYCGVADTDPAGHGTGHPFLAVNGNTDSFALCMSGTQNNIVYRPLVTSTQYDPSTCQQVKVQIIF